MCFEYAKSSKNGEAKSEPQPVPCKCGKAFKPLSNVTHFESETRKKEIQFDCHYNNVKNMQYIAQALS